jgi:hypothetical protein
VLNFSLIRSLVRSLKLGESMAFQPNARKEFPSAAEPQPKIM